LQVPRERVMGNLSVTVTGVSVQIHSGPFRRDIGRAFSAASSKDSSILFFSRFDSRSRSHRGSRGQSLQACIRRFRFRFSVSLRYRRCSLRHCMFRARRWWHSGKCGNLLRPGSSSVCTYARTDPKHKHHWSSIKTSARMFQERFSPTMGGRESS
jgi:hypothetical protein